ncbi:dehydrogenase with different specificitie [Lophiotrema nucula]|uniref:Dehydrogenase with different specificitie n=1 Tax=Lophiotrema nucula TaxID=690887 RepID=A0A6A5YHC5_9PLEO|nr:dehydrogenase with different specificitie [Lophiotrema nucula]
MGYQISYEPDRDIPDLAGKVFLITGGTNGLGRQTVLALSEHNPEHIYFTGRNERDAASLIGEIGPAKSTFIRCDQTSVSSVHGAAHKFLALSKRLDVLICNAGVMAIPPGLTKDGYELHFGINHLSHAVFIKYLLPVLQKTAEEHGEARVVSLASLAVAHTPAGGIVFDLLRTPQDDLGITAKWMRYGQSKLANVLYTRELAKRYPWLTTVSLEPGTVWTGLLSNLGFLDRIFLTLGTWGKTLRLEQGAYNSCWASTSNRKDLKSGGFYKPVGVEVGKIGYSEDEELAKTLWEWTENQIDAFKL